MKAQKEHFNGIANRNAPLQGSAEKQISIIIIETWRMRYRHLVFSIRPIHACDGQQKSQQVQVRMSNVHKFKTA